jgi:hypothetical protein
VVSADLFNGLFEFGGTLFLALNVRQILRDKTVQGVSVWPTAFYSAWGGWNLFYYPSLDQWFSFAGGIGVCVANLIWVALAIHYTRKNK